MPDHNWLLEVLADISSYAKQHDLDRVGTLSALMIDVARLDLDEANALDVMNEDPQPLHLVEDREEDP